jgi:hypothetical protein
MPHTTWKPLIPTATLRIARSGVIVSLASPTQCPVSAAKKALNSPRDASGPIKQQPTCRLRAIVIWPAGTDEVLKTRDDGNRHSNRALDRSSADCIKSAQKFHELAAIVNAAQFLSDSCKQQPGQQSPLQLCCRTPSASELRPDSHALTLPRQGFASEGGNGLPSTPVRAGPPDHLSE